MRISPNGVLVFASAETAEVTDKFNCSVDDLAYALSIKTPQTCKSRINIEVKESQIVAHTMIKLGFFSSITSIYNRTYDAMIDIQVAFSFVESEIAFRSWSNKIFKRTNRNGKGR